MSTKAAPSKRSARTKGPSRGQAKSKIVVRRLPANLPEHIFMESIKGLVSDSALDRPTTWVAGKVSKNPVKANTFARAYIYFKNEKVALEFQRAYHGHTFVDRHGNEGKAHVEFAPFQKIPREQRKADTKQGTIEEDPDYIAFLLSLTADPTDAEKEMKLSGTEQLLKESAINPKSTPLLEALRAQKAAAQAKAQAAKLAARQARQAGKAGISNAGKVQITILANRNAKDAANKAGAITSTNSSASANKPQQSQGKKAVQVPEAESTQQAKPKRERKRRDRASKRAGNEAASTGNSNHHQGEPITPQITLLKPKNAQSGPQPSNSAAHGSGQQEARPQSTHGQTGQGGPNPGGRRGHQNQAIQHNQGNSNNNNNNNINNNSSSTPQAGNPGSGVNTKKESAQPANAEGGQGRSGRSRRNRGDRAKQDPKATGDNATGGNSSTSTSAQPNANNNSNNANSGSNTGNKPEGQSGGGRSGRNRRGRGGGQENSTTPTAQG